MTDAIPPLGLSWFYARANNRLGPVTEPDLKALATRGEIDGTTLIWREGMADWKSFSNVFGAALAPPPLPGSAVSEHTYRRKDVGVTILLSIVTLTIYALIVFYQIGVGYERVAQRRDSKFQALFWSYVGFYVISSIVTVVTFWGGMLLYIPCMIVGAFLLADVLASRAEASKRIGFTKPQRSTSAHVATWVVGNVLCYVLVGLILLIVQAVWFLEEHNELVEPREQLGAAARG